MDIRTEPFKAEHLISIADNIIEPTYAPQEWRNDWAKYNEATSVALTAFIDGRIIGCGGIHTDTNIMWVVLEKQARNHKKEVLWATKKLVEILTKDLELDRVRAQVSAGFDEGRRFVRHLGFKPLNTQIQAGFDDYERVFKWEA